jgi:hypothetical protein
MRSRTVGWLLVAAAAVLAALWVSLPSLRRAALHLAAGGEDAGIVGGRMPSLEGASAWLNSPPLPPDSLSGRVVALLAWTCADLESERAVPVVEQLADRYGAYGLRVVLVHEPLYTFAQDSAVVAASCLRMETELPVALDSEGSLRSRFPPGALPALLLADARGVVRYAHAGAGGADAAERQVRALLAARPGAAPLPPPLVRSPDAEPQGGPIQSIPLAAGATAGPLGRVQAGETRVFAPALRTQVEREDGVPVPVGTWFAGAEGLRSVGGTAADYLALGHDAAEVYLVMGGAGGEPARVWVLEDEHWLAPDELGADARLDARGASCVVVDAPRVYHVARNPAGGHHVLKLQPDRPGVDLYRFELERHP